MRIDNFKKEGMFNLQAYKNLNLLDVKNEVLIKDAVIIVQEGRFKNIGQNIEIPKDAEVTDLQGKTVIPGLIDAHIHSMLDASANPEKNLIEENDALTIIKAQKALANTLKAGITYVRDLGGAKYLDLGLRDAVNKGLIKGPRMQVAGKMITMTGGHGHKMGREVDGTAEARKAAREQLKAGVDVVKIMATGGVMTEGVEPGSPQLTLEEIKAAVKEAHKAGRKTASHAQGTTGIQNAVKAGIDSIEHGIFLDQKTVDLMSTKNTFLVATLTAPYWIVEKGVENGIPEFAVKKSEKIIKSHCESFKLALDNNIKIAMGTDAGTPFNEHGKNTYELKLMVEAGMSSMQAIKAATLGGAELLGIIEDFGSIETGKVADMVVLNGNPLDRIEDVFKVVSVFKAGKLVV